MRVAITVMNWTLASSGRLAGGRRASLLDLLGILEGILGCGTEPRFEAPRPGDVRHSLADTTRAQETFGFVPTIGFAEGLARTFDWYRKSSDRGDDR